MTQAVTRHASSFTFAALQCIHAFDTVIDSNGNWPVQPAPFISDILFHNNRKENIKRANTLTTACVDLGNIFASFSNQDQSACVRLIVFVHPCVVS